MTWWKGFALSNYFDDVKHGFAIATIWIYNDDLYIVWPTNTY